MKGCPKLIPNTYIHILIGIILIAIAAQQKAFRVTTLPGIIGLVVALFAVEGVLLFSSPGWFKYVLAIVFALLLGLMITPVADKLNAAGTTTRVLVATGAIFAGFTLLSFTPWGRESFKRIGALVVALIALIVVEVGTEAGFWLSDAKKPGWLYLGESYAFLAVFSLLITADTSKLFDMASKPCPAKPDYIEYGLGLVLDLVNIFVRSSNAS